MSPSAEEEKAQRAAVVAEALTWQMTPYHLEARIKGVGVDCVQLILAAFKANGIMEDWEPGPYYAHRDRSQDALRMVDMVARFCRKLPEGETPAPGDLALFHGNKGVCHIAIVLEWPRVLHAYRSSGVVQDDVSQNKGLGDRLAEVWSHWGGAQ